jgi:hypothetical protein
MCVLFAFRVPITDASRRLRLHELGGMDILRHSRPTAYPTHLEAGYPGVHISSIVLAWYMLAALCVAACACGDIAFWVDYPQYRHGAAETCDHFARWDLESLVSTVKR